MAELTTEALETLKAQLKTAAEGKIDVAEITYTSPVENVWVNRQLKILKTGQLPITEMYVAVEKLVTAIKSIR